jgi:beta-barrel assembly-enhancing protease
MNSRSTIPVLSLMLAAFASGGVGLACPAPQTSRSDSDLNAIGHRNVGKSVNLYSVDKEKALGKQLASEVERASRLIDDPFVTAYLDHITQNIAKNSDARVPITIRVIDSDVINAFTLPGGFQYVNSGLILQTESEAALAGVLARGIAHSALRSSTMVATKGELMQFATVPLMLLEPGGWAGYGTYQGLNLSVPVTYLKFWRDAENSADYFGLQYLYKAGYDPEAYIQIMERVWSHTPAGKQVPEVFSSYPPLPERLKNMKKEIASILPRRDGAIISSPEFETAKERLRAWKLQNNFRPDGDLHKPTLRKPTDNPSPEPPSLMPDCE